MPGLDGIAAANRDAAAGFAAELYLSEGTVRNYLSAAIRKLSARNRREAIERAVEKRVSLTRSTDASSAASPRTATWIRLPPVSSR